MYIHAGDKGIKKKKKEPRRRALKKRGRGTYKADKPPDHHDCWTKREVTLFFSGRKTLIITINTSYRYVNTVKHGVTVYTDKYPIYNGLKKLRKSQSA
jgi:hypothetical protein